ncbi:MAG: glycosyltransferase family 39 protein [Solirubrobacteraceae bacterium]|nr:glycosyltransferase family 39 protein [Solirubrobacteraceae bacterium]
MSTADDAQRPDPDRGDAGAPETPTADRSHVWWWALGAIVLVGLLLRLWGIRWGLPFAYNLDERSHFVPRSVEFFASGSIDPDYQLNPAGLIQWIAAALWLTHWSSDGIVDTWRTDPGQIWTIARVASALLSTAAIALLYLAGSRLFDRRVGLVAAAILATAFLPVHYGHLALNDGPSLAFTALGLFAIAGIVRFGRRRDYVLAGAALGAAMGFKYNAAFVGLPLGTAALLHATGWRWGDLRSTDDGAARDRGADLRAGLRLPLWRPALLGLVLAGAATVAAFFVCNPYAFLRPAFFLDQVEHLSNYTKGGLLLGETQSSGYRYYAWSLGWGFGLLPLALAFVGGLRMLAAARWQALILLPAPLIFLLYVGSQGRYFARYAMPVYPLLALIAAAGAVWLATWLLDRARARGGVRVALGVVAAAIVLAQGVVNVVHNNGVLTEEDTRSSARAWMVDNVPPGTTLVVEPMMPKEWYADGARLPDPRSHEGYRWSRLVRTGADKEALIERYPERRGQIRRPADFANYGFTLFPELLDFYREKGACWIVSGALQSGRSFNNPHRVPQAIRYYRALERQSDLRFAIDATDRGSVDAHYFQYDLAFNFLPRRYERPGGAMRVYQLRDCTPRVAKPGT